MGKLITYTCDKCCISTYQICNDQDRFPPGWYTLVTCMGRKVEYICHDCYEKMCQSGNGFLGGD